MGSMSIWHWLVVAVNTPIPSHLENAIAATFNAYNKAEFAATLNAAIAGRAQVASVLVLAAREEEYAEIEESLEGIGAHVFFLAGGIGAWQEHSSMMDAMQKHQVVVAKSMAGGGALVRPAGCGGCPK